MRPFAIPCALLLAVAAGCASTPETAPEPALPTTRALPGAQAPSNPTDEILRQPALLKQHGDAARAANDLHLAYRYYALVHLLHPESEEDAEVFPWAVAIFKYFYNRNREVDPQSIWLNSEPLFVFEWLEGFYGDDFPEREVMILLGRLPHPFAMRYIEFARQRPASAGWMIELEDDNGEIVAVRGERMPRDRS